MWCDVNADIKVVTSTTIYIRWDAMIWVWTGRCLFSVGEMSCSVDVDVESESRWVDVVQCVVSLFRCWVEWWAEWMEMSRRRDTVTYRKQAETMMAVMLNADSLVEKWRSGSSRQSQRIEEARRSRRRAGGRNGRMWDRGLKNNRRRRGRLWTLTCKECE